VTLLKPHLDVTALTQLWSGLNHPEDLVWDSHRRVIYAGGEHGELYRGSLTGEWAKVAECGESACLLGLALDEKGNVYACDIGNSRVIQINPDDFSVVVISTGCAERPMVSPNYPAFDPNGRLFVSDSGAWGQDEGVIYVIDSLQGTSVWSSAVSDFPNGIAFSSDNSHLYVVESHSSSVWRVEVDGAGGAGQATRVWNEPLTVPDGIAFDIDGRLYVACYTPCTIYMVEPDLRSGQILAHDWTAQLMRAPTNLAFLGDDLALLGSANFNGHHLNIMTPPSPGLVIQRPPF